MSNLFSTCSLPWSALILLLLANLSAVHGLTEFQVLSVVKEFADSYLAPRNVQVAHSINSTLFAEDVTGTADLSTNFDGRELSTEYLFGLFVNTAEDPNDPSPFGSPVSYNVTALLVQHNMISTSIKFQFHYPILNQTFPIQIDAFMQVNENREIQQYDVSFRRWGWATDHIIPLLIPHMAAGLNMTNTTDPSSILRQYLSRKICQTAMNHCQGPDEQYGSWDECMEFLNAREVGEWYRMGEDNLVCRHLHVPMLALRPSVHCAHIGPSGGDMCIARDYNSVVLEDHFPHGWLAPKFVTPENQAEVGDIYAVSGADLDPLLDISLSANDTHSWDPTLYATALLGYFLFFYIVSNGLWFVYFRHCQIFPTLGLEHQKNVVMYTMNIIFTTISLALELVATPAFAGRYALWEVQCLRTAGVLVSGLYIFELIYRLKMRVPMIIHHFLTIFAISFTVTVFEYTQSMTYLGSAVIWLFQATTEQPTFLGLLGYRLDWNPATVARVLKFASFQTFVLKLASAIALMVYWGLHQNYTYRPMDIAWTSLVFIIAIGLLLTQIWGSWVTYSIGRRLLIHSQLPQARFKGSTLSVYQTIRLREHKRSVSDATADSDSPNDHAGSAVDDRYEVVTTHERSPRSLAPSIGLEPGSRLVSRTETHLSATDVDGDTDTSMPGDHGAMGGESEHGTRGRLESSGSFPPWATASGYWSKASSIHHPPTPLLSIPANQPAGVSPISPGLGSGSGLGLGLGGPSSASELDTQAWRVPLPDSPDSEPRTVAEGTGGRTTPSTPLAPHLATPGTGENVCGPSRISGSGTMSDEPQTGQRWVRSETTAGGDGEPGTAL